MTAVRGKPAELRTKVASPVVEPARTLEPSLEPRRPTTKQRVKAGLDAPPSRTTRRAGGANIAALRAGEREPLPAGFHFFIDALVDLRARARDGQPCATVFDMDQTLIRTSERLLAAARVFGRDHGVPQLEHLQLDQIEPDAKQTCARCGVTDRTTVDEFHSFWWKHIWKSESFALDRPSPVALLLAHAARAAGAEIHIVTGRNPQWESETRAQLEQLGIGTAKLHFKPLGAETDAFKAESVEQLAGTHHVAWALDDSASAASRMPKSANAVVLKQVRPDGSASDERVPTGVRSLDATLDPRAFDRMADAVRDALPDVHVNQAEITRLASSITLHDVPMMAEGLLPELADTKYERLREPSQILAYAEEQLAGRPQRLAVGGFFRPPTREHERLASGFVEGLVKALDPDRVALLTSHTTVAFDDGSSSLDRWATKVGHKTGAKMFYLVSERYVGRGSVDSIASDGQSAIAYAAAQKHVFPSNEEYAKAEMLASSALVLTGGKNISVSDFVKELSLDRRVVLFNDLNLPAWSEAENKPANAIAYLQTMIARFRELSAGSHTERANDPSQYPFPFMPADGFTIDFLKRNAGRLASVGFAEARDERDLPNAIAQSAAFLDQPSVFEKLFDIHARVAGKAPKTRDLVQYAQALATVAGIEAPRSQERLAELRQQILETSADRAGMAGIIQRALDAK